MPFGEFLKNFIFLFAELTLLFVGISFLVSWIQQLVPEDKIKNILSRPKGWKGYVYGTALGSLTPFCSCSTIPILAGLLSSKAPFGPSMSFLIASPLLNPVIIVLLWTLLGWQLTLYYTVLMFGAAMLIGMVWNVFQLEQQLKNVSVRKSTSTDETSIPKWKLAIRDAWSFFIPILPYLFIGVLIGSLIYGFVPETFLSKYAGSQNIWAIPISAVIGIPMYIRAETLLPISGALVNQGMGIGAVVALIIGGAGASIPEVILLSRLFKQKLLVAFVASILLLAITAGMMVQFVI